MFKCSRCGSTVVPHHGNGLCRNCYMKSYRRGQLTPAMRQSMGREEVVEAIEAMISPHGGSCWLEGNKVYLKLQGYTLSCLLPG